MIRVELMNSYPIPAPTSKDTKLVMSTVKKTSFEKRLFFLSFGDAFALLGVLSLLEEEDFRLRTLAKVHSRLLHGMFGFEDQSHMMSEAVKPPCMSCSGLTIWLMYTAFNSSWNEEASSGLGVLGGDLGDPLGLFLPDIKADEMGDTLDEERLDSRCASRNIRK